MSFQELPVEMKELIRSFNQHTPKQLKGILALEIAYMRTLKKFMIIKNVLEYEYVRWMLLMNPSAVVNLLLSYFYKWYNRIMASPKKESNVWGFFRRIAGHLKLPFSHSPQFLLEYRLWLDIILLMGEGRQKGTNRWDWNMFEEIPQTLKYFGYFLKTYKNHFGNFLG